MRSSHSPNADATGEQPQRCFSVRICSDECLPQPTSPDLSEATTEVDEDDIFAGSLSGDDDSFDGDDDMIFAFEEEAAIEEASSEGEGVNALVDLFFMES